MSDLQVELRLQSTNLGTSSTILHGVVAEQRPFLDSDWKGGLYRCLIRSARSNNRFLKNI